MASVVPLTIISEGTLAMGEPRRAGLPLPPPVLAELVAVEAADLAVLAELAALAVLVVALGERAEAPAVTLAAPAALVVALGERGNYLKH